MSTMSRLFKAAIANIFTIFACAVLLLAAGFYFMLEGRSSSESQTLTGFAAPKLGDYLSGSFQNQFEQALKDQFVLHDQAIGLMASIKAYLGGGYNVLDNLLHGRPAEDGLLPYGNVYRMYGTDWLTNLPYTYDEETAQNTIRKAQELNDFALRYPSARVYVYYCTRAEDLDWFDESDGIKSYSYSQLLRESLNESIRFDQLKFRDFTEYSRLMYRTDHHWNNAGAACGYADILGMMSKGTPLGRARSILYTEAFDHLLWRGSRSRESALTIPAKGLDPFLVDEYILPGHRTWFGEREQEIGLRAAYKSGEVNRELGFDQYLNYYGFESQPIRLEYEGGAHNLLIVGDSFARALREPLSSHFATTVYVNFRILTDIDLDAVMTGYEIDTVLFMGQQDAWSGYYLYGGDAP